MITWSTDHQINENPFDGSNDTLNIFKALINAGADVNVTDYDGQTALDIGNL